jgi:3-deoxy-7-phosphoheptulonate synthase
MCEVHNNPELAKSDGEQALLPHEFADLVARVKKVAAAVGRSV